MFKNHVNPTERTHKQHMKFETHQIHREQCYGVLIFYIMMIQKTTCCNVFL